MHDQKPLLSRSAWHEAAQGVVPPAPTQAQQLRDQQQTDSRTPPETSAPQPSGATQAQQLRDQQQTHSSPPPETSAPQQSAPTQAQQLRDQQQTGSSSSAGTSAPQPSGAALSSQSEQHISEGVVQSGGGASQGGLTPLGSSPRQSAIHKLRSISVKHLFGIKPVIAEDPLVRANDVDGHSSGTMQDPTTAVPAVLPAATVPATVPQAAAAGSSAAMSNTADLLVAIPPDAKHAGSSTTGGAPLSPRRSISLAKLRSHSLAKQLPGTTSQPQAFTPFSQPPHSPTLNGFSPPLPTTAVRQPQSTPQPPQASHYSSAVLGSAAATMVHDPLQGFDAHSACAKTTTVAQHAPGQQASAGTAVELADIDVMLLQEAGSASAPALAPQLRAECVSPGDPSVRVSISADGQRASLSLQVTKESEAAGQTMQGYAGPSHSLSHSTSPVPDAATENADALLATAQMPDSMQANAVQLEHQGTTANQSSWTGKVVSMGVQTAHHHHMQPDQAYQQPLLHPLEEPQSHLWRVGHAPQANTAEDDSLSGNSQVEQQLHTGTLSNAKHLSASVSPGKKSKSGQGLLSKLEGGLRSLLYKSKSQPMQQAMVSEPLALKTDLLLLLLLLLLLVLFLLLSRQQGFLPIHY